MKKYFLILKIIFLFFSYVAFAYEGDYGTENVFLVGSGARADAMGQAFTGLSDDLSCILYNVAGLNFLERQEIYFGYYPLYEGTNTGFLSYAHPILDLGVFAGSINRFTAGKIAGYDLNDKLTKSFSVEEYKINLSFAREFYKNLYFGIGLNIYNFNYSDLNATGFGADTGILYEPVSFLRIGLSINNFIKPVFSMKEEKEGIPLRYALGVLCKFNFSFLKFNITSDLIYGEAQNLKLNSGIECGIYDSLFLRTGYNDGIFTAGAGINLMSFTLDYATLFNNYLGNLHRFTLSYSFGKTLKEQKEELNKKILLEIRKQVEERFNLKLREKSSEYYKRAYEFYKNNEYEQALLETDNALEWYPENENAQKMKVYLENMLKEKLLGNIKYNIKKEAEKNFINGINLYIRKKYALALKEWEKAKEKDPENKFINLYIEKARQNLKIKIEKKEILTQKEEEEIEKLYYEAINSYTDGNLEKAINLWKKVLDINPGNIKALRNIEKTQAEIEELKKRGIK